MRFLPGFVAIKFCFTGGNLIATVYGYEMSIL